MCARIMAAMIAGLFHDDIFKVNESRHRLVKRDLVRLVRRDCPTLLAFGIAASTFAQTVDESQLLPHRWIEF